MPFDFVADVTCLRGRVLASSNAYLKIRSTPRREKMLSWTQIPRRYGEHPAADARILALRIFAHDDEVDLLRLAPRQRGTHSRQQPARPDVGVLVEAAADRDEQTPERHMVRHVRPADRAKQDGVRSFSAAQGRPRASWSPSACSDRTTSRSRYNRWESQSVSPRRPARERPRARFRGRCRLRQSGRSSRHGFHDAADVCD